MLPGRPGPVLVARGTRTGAPDGAGERGPVGLVRGRAMMIIANVIVPASTVGP
ncbi:hypothetical protein Ae505Ps2_0549c [Pseudonocardia sp. Ae505_Ps2]|nr:hypothetical protein Ae331Ps2_1205c [Pseudonocardia sp. Ae331_Ps2]OLM10426.1 hypothetical protein Ae505Ps2_0549c [Pseudonocardia sp. Ae505_Ps2]